jgi:hypothetical protein
MVWPSVAALFAKAVAAGMNPMDLTRPGKGPRRAVVERGAAEL